MIYRADPIFLSEESVVVYTFLLMISEGLGHIPLGGRCSDLHLSTETEWTRAHVLLLHSGLIVEIHT